MSLLTDWESFYVIVGTSAAALTGLMFVVITLVAGRRERSPGGLAAFGTPNVVHFGAALLIAAVLSAPWQILWPITVLLGLASLVGVAYVFIVARRAGRQTDYQPVFEDWLFHVALPFVAYGALIIAAIVLLSNPMPAMFAIGAVTVLLVFIGIHNAWDAVTYLVVQLQPSQSKPED